VEAVAAACSSSYRTRGARCMGHVGKLIKSQPAFVVIPELIEQRERLVVEVSKGDRRAVGATGRGRRARRGPAPRANRSARSPDQQVRAMRQHSDCSFATNKEPSEDFRYLRCCGHGAMAVSTRPAHPLPRTSLSAWRPRQSPRGDQRGPAEATARGACAGLVALRRHGSEFALVWGNSER
jgi:hypothetical protein